MSWRNWNWIQRFISPVLSAENLQSAKSRDYHPNALLNLRRTDDVILTIKTHIKTAGWVIKEKPDIKAEFFKRFSSTLPGTVWVSNGFWKKSPVSQASVLAHEFVHFLQWTQMSHDPNVFLKYYATPVGGWIMETQAIRFQMAMHKTLVPSLTHDDALNIATRKAKSLWRSYPNIKLLKYDQVMEETPRIIMMGWHSSHSPDVIKKVPRRPGGLSHR